MSVSQAEWGTMLDTVQCYMDEWYEAANQTFKKGDLVYRNAGFATICGADPAVIGAISLQDAHSDATPGKYKVHVLVITQSTALKMCVYHSVPANDVIEAADHGKAYGIVHSGGKWLVDKTDTSETRVRVQRFIDPLGTESGKVLVTVLPAYREVA